MVTMIRSDLDFILAQIKIAEADARGETLLGTHIPNSELPWGLRRVDGSNNNLTPGQGNYGAADQPFGSLSNGGTPLNEADDGMRFGPPRLNPDGSPQAGFEGGPIAGTTIVVPPGYRAGFNFLANNDYGTHTANNPALPARAIQPGDVVDADPRTISNLIVDQTLNNPAIVYKALQNAGSADPFAAMQEISTAVGELKAARASADPALIAEKTANLQLLIDNAGIATDNTPGNTDILKVSLMIPNVAPDAGLSAPFNGWMTLFGQFFDHGLDLVAKGGFGTVYVPLQPDDPLYVPGSNTNFMALTRSTLDANGQAVNNVTPFVDQNQTYTSHASAQVFHREYEMRADGAHSTGRLLNGVDGGLATWADIKAQSISMLGIKLNDMNIHSIPLLATDPYGNFIPGANGFAQVVLSVQVFDGTGALVRTQQVQVEGIAGGLDINDPALLPTGVTLNPGETFKTSFVPTGHAFLDDIAHNANPDAGERADEASDFASGIDGISKATDRLPAGTYDNELLDRHFITGDGRGNENIGLTAIHHVFHSEHNRQISLIKDLVLGEAKDAAAAAALNPLDTRLAAVAAEKLGFLNEWLDADLTAATLPAATLTSVVWDGERLFQAAKVPTEMQYQHLVFEEFARTVQPFVNAFNDYDGTLNAAIVGEFAHTVYRFGHSMLNETVDRLTPDNQSSIGTGGTVGADQIGLIEAFLNPVEFNAGGLTAEQSAGAIARGMTRQHANEIDEFVTEALRNNLVGLPLDLATLNIARGRETNVPTLNEARAEFYAGSSDAQVRPYTSWTDFAANLKNPASVVNFIASYGTHATITAATTVAAKRDAAMKLVLGGADAPADRLDFLGAKNAYAGGSLGGLNNVDFWIGGLAEKQMAFGGMLGTTFNFVFEVQMERLQDGDRFYYLSRLANLNLTAQLENNKFSEMIARNTDAKHLPGNVFKKMDYQLEVDQSQQLNDGLGNADPTGALNGLDPWLGSMNEDRKVIRANPNGQAGNYLQFIGPEHVVLGGTEQNDTLIGDEGDDTLWGDGGDDRLEGGIGNDFIFGGEGNDIITDQFGDDEIRSGGGDDVVNGGQGINLIITDTGNDFVWGGLDDEEMLLGQGNDFADGGAGVETIIGGEGNDWIESGIENGLLLGDNGDLIQGLPIKRSVDSTIVGHDVLLATGGNQDFDAETGDDIMVGGMGTDRFFGQFGFDWATYKFDPFGIEADMNNRLFAPPTMPASPGAILDRYAQMEALSGSSHTDFLRGDDQADLGAGGGVGTVTATGLVTAVPLDHALYDENVALIDGLDAFLGSINEAGDVRYSAGNILLGGSGSDVIEGRGGNDLIDGNLWLNVRINVMSADGSTVLETVDGMKDIQQRMFTGEIKVAQLRVVREIVDDKQNAAGKAIAGSSNLADTDNVDIAQYSGPRDDYDIVNNGDGSFTITHLVRDGTGAIVPGSIGIDGVDRLTNIERLLFSDGVIKLVDHANSIATGAPTINGAFNVGQVLTASLTGLSDADGLPIGTDTSKFTVYWQVEVTPGSGVFTNLSRIIGDETAPVTGLTFTPTATEAGLALRAFVVFKDGQGVVEFASSAASVVGGAAGIPAAPVPPAVPVALGVELGVGGLALTIDGVALPAGTIGIVEDGLAAPGVPAPGTVTFSTAQLLAGIVDPNPGDVVTLVPGSVAVRVRPGDTAPGTLLDNGDGTFTFTPVANFNGGVVFTFNVTDGNTPPVGVEATLDVIAVNDAPVPGTNTTNIGTALAGAGATITFTDAQLIGNATDVDGDRIDLARFAGGVGAARFVQLANPAQGTLTLNPDGSYTFTANAGFNGNVVLNYAITDGTVDVATTATLTLTNAAPTSPTLTTNTTVVNAGAVPATLANVGPTAGQPLTVNTAAITDANGIASPFTIVWQSSTTGDPGTFTAIPGAPNAATFTPGAAMVGRFIQAVVTFTDGGGTLETVFASAVRPAGNTINGTVGANILGGTAGDDVVSGLGGVDTLNGNNGNDLLIGGAGRDTVNGGAGNDVIVWNVGDGNGNNAATGNDIVNGGLGGTDTFVVNGNGTAETFNVYARADWLALGRTTVNANSDIIITRNGTGQGNVIAELDEIEEIVINTGAGADTVNVIGDFTPTNLAFNTIHVNNEGGEDTVDVTEVDSEHRVVLTSTDGGTGSIVGQRSQDQVINAGPGNGDDEDEDEHDNEDENDDVNDNGNDNGNGNGGGNGPGAGPGSGGTVTSPHVVFVGTGGNDAGFGRNGDDDMFGDAGNDTLFGRGGDDNIVGGDGDDDIFSGDGNDIASGGAGADRIFGDAGDDTILGGSGNDRLLGGDGNDAIWGDGGRDVVNGGRGNDVIFASGGNDGNDVFDGDEGIDTVNYEAVISSDLSIDLAAGIASSSETGEDRLVSIENVVGGGGNDTIYASDAINVLNGGAGNDTFVFRSAAAADGDRIEGFNTGDKVDLSGIFGGQTPATVTPGTFTAAGQVRLSVDGDGNTHIEGNTDDNADVDFSIIVAGHIVTRNDLA